MTKTKRLISESDRRMLQSGRIRPVERKPHSLFAKILGIMALSVIASGIFAFVV